MLLRASSEHEGETVDLSAVTGGTESPSGVADEDVLIPFAEAAVAHDPQTLPAARDAVAKRMGDAALVDAACIVANFQRMVRIADGTGIPIDTPLSLVSADMRDELGISEFGSSASTPPVQGVRRILGRALQPVVPYLMRRFRPPEADES